MNTKVLPFVIPLILLLSFSGISFGQAPNLGAASSFALFTSAGAFNNVGTTTIVGDIGTNVGAFTGFPPGIVIGQIHVADAISAQAASDLGVAYASLAGQTCGLVIGTTLGNGQILTPNIYCLGAASVLNGSLILNAQGNPNAIFIFQINGALSTSTFANVTLINGAEACNVYWQINGAFALGDNSVFRGTALINGAISLNTNSTLIGKALSTSGAISTSANVVHISSCAPPVVTCPPPVTVSCATQVPVSNIASVGVTVTCTGPFTVSFVGDVISGQTCPNKYTITRTYLATDACGNTATCAQLITVNDITPPTITCPANLSVYCAAAVPAPAPGAIVATDLCGGTVNVVFLSDAISNQICTNRFTITRTYLATDACGNSATCSQIITVNNTPLTIICPADVTVTCATGVPSPTPGTVPASDNCGGTITVAFLGDVISNQTCPNHYTITRTYRVTDACGNTATCAQTITVVDVPPTIACPANVTVSCANQVPPGAPGSVTASSGCNSGITVIWLEDVVSNQTCANRYTISRTYQATSACGAISVCTQIITVNDQTPPTITCPVNATVTCFNQVPTAAPASIVTTDNCGGVSTAAFLSDVVTSQLCSNRLTIVRSYRATDLCGNSAVCTQTITVNDQNPPILTCPVNVTVACANLVPNAVPGSVTASDNCGGIVNILFLADAITGQTCPNRYLITRSFLGTDLCGNSAVCSQLITVNDQTAPTLACPVNVTVSCPSNVPAPAPASVTTTDNCGGSATVVFVGDVISNQICISQYTITRTYRATDLCGNSATCAQIITVNGAPPSITCPANITVSCAANVPVAAPGSVLTSSLCGGVVTVVLVGDVISAQICTNRFTITRTYRATDACGNTAVCAQTITVFDNTPPVFVNFPANVTVDCSVVPPVLAPGGVDNCGGSVTITFLGQTQSPSICPTLYTLTRVWRATDDCGNSATASQIVSVTDTYAPQFTANPVDVILECDVTTNQTAFQNWLNNHGGATVFDCSAVIWTFTDSPFNINYPPDCAATFHRFIRFIATDACGNSSFRDARFTVEDNTPPTFTVLPQNSTFECWGGDNGQAQMFEWLAHFGYAQVTDKCGSVATSIVFISEKPGCGNTFTRTYEFRATDQCGNTNFVQATFSVVDTTPPTIICPPGNVFLTCENDIPPPNPGGVITTDNCSSNIKITWTEHSAGVGCVYWPKSKSYWYMATDECGNMSNCDQSFIVIDSIPPTYTGPDTIKVSCVSDLPISGDVTAILAPYMHDNCYKIICIGECICPTVGDSNSVTFKINAKDLCGNWAKQFIVTFLATGSCKPICTVPQAVWGDKNGLIDGITTTTAMDKFITLYGGVTAGKLGKTISVTSTDCLFSLLPSIGNTAQFGPGDHHYGTPLECQGPSKLLNSDGTLKNQLAANVLALQLNLWFNQEYNQRNLGAQLLSALPVCVVGPIYLDKLNTDLFTVADLLDLSNGYLSGVGFFPPGFGNILNTALDNLNNYWLNCKTNDPCPAKISIRDDHTGANNLSHFSLAPNPVVGIVTLTFEMGSNAELHIRFVGNAGIQSETITPVVKGINTLSYDTKTFPAGIYTIVLQDDKELHTLRMVKVVD